MCRGFCAQKFASSKRIFEFCGCPAYGHTLPIVLSIAHLFGIEKRKRNSGPPLFPLYLREQNCKPGSVSDSHLSRRTVAGTLKPPRERPGQPIAPIPVLLRIEFTASDCSQPMGELLPRLSTLTRRSRAVYLCCTFPEVAFGGRYPLSLPCGARTFLMNRLSPCPRDCLAYSHEYCTRPAAESQPIFAECRFVKHIGQRTPLERASGGAS